MLIVSSSLLFYPDSKRREHSKIHTDIFLLLPLFSCTNEIPHNKNIAYQLCETTNENKWRNKKKIKYDECIFKCIKTLKLLL